MTARKGHLSRKPDRARRGRPKKEDTNRTFDRDLAKIATEESELAREDLGAQEHATIVREVLDVFFNIWIRFAVDIGKELRMSPWQWDFVVYDGGKNYRFRESFNFSRVNEMILEEAGFPYRHRLRAELRTLGGRIYVTVAFVLEEGRAYEKTEAVSARGVYTLYNEQARKFSVHELKKTLAEPLRVWIRSELRGDPSLLWDFCHDKLRRGN